MAVHRSVSLAQTKPHILKAKGGAWHVAAMSTVPHRLVKAAIEYRNKVLEARELRSEQYSEEYLQCWENRGQRSYDDTK